MFQRRAIVWRFKKSKIKQNKKNHSCLFQTLFAFIHALLSTTTIQSLEDSNLPGKSNSNCTKLTIWRLNCPGYFWDRDLQSNTGQMISRAKKCSTLHSAEAYEYGLILLHWPRGSISYKMRSQSAMHVYFPLVKMVSLAPPASKRRTGSNQTSNPQLHHRQAKRHKQSEPPILGRIPLWLFSVLEVRV